jgi:type VI secretion system protein ImpC
MRLSGDRIGFDIAAESRAESAATREDEPFRIALIGDFGGSARKPVAERRPVSVDPDNFESVLARMEVEFEAAGSRVRITELDDFHPDNLYAKLPVFRSFRELRKRLANPETFAEAAKELLGEAPAAPPPTARASGDLLDQILGGGAASPAAARPPARPTSDLQEFIRAAVRPHLLPGEDPRAPELIRRVDQAAAEHMRAVLHDPQFQALESAWRVVLAFLRRLEIGVALKLYLVDLTKEELAENAQTVAEALVEDSDPWAVLVGNFSIGANDCELAASVGAMARAANAPFLAEAAPSLLKDDPASAWGAFRRSAEAAWVGLALPRVLLRAPYGKDSDPCETFAFEEIADAPVAKQMLFGNPGAFCAILLGQAFEQHGWDFRPGAVREIGQLPVYVYAENGERKAFPCAEVELRESTAEAVMDCGLMPVAAVRGTDKVRLLRFQSAANPPTALPGRWRG